METTSCEKWEKNSSKPGTKERINEFQQRKKTLKYLCKTASCFLTRNGGMGLETGALILQSFQASVFLL